MIASNIICRGASRFLNKAYFQDVQIGGSATLSSLSLSGNLTVTGTSTFTGAATFSSTITATGNITSSGNLYANGGYLYLNNKIAADGGKTTANQLTINGSNAFTVGTYIKNILKTDTLNATNVNVSNNLRANHYDLQTVAQLGGSFYVSPTVKFPNSGTTLAVAKSGTTLTLTIKDSSITSATMAGVVWTAGSGVKVSGTINGVVTGTMDGTVSSINTSSHTLTLSVSGENSGNVQASPSGSPYNASQFKDLSVMLYTRKQDGTIKMINTANGAIASFTDGGNNVPVKQLVVDIEPVQDLHGQANPYPAGGSKNKCKPIKNGTFNGVTVSTDATGKTTVTGTATGGGGRLNLCSDSFTLPAGTYTVSHNGSGTWGYTLSLSAPGGSQLYECRATSTSATITLSAETTLVAGISIESGKTYNGTIEPQIESGSSKTAYAPYANICPISGHTSAVVPRTGTNVWDEETVAGYYHGSTGAFVPQSSTMGSKNPIPVKPNTTYYLKSGTYNINVNCYGADMSPISQLYHKHNNTFTTPSNCYFINISNDFGSGATYNHDISINYPATDTDYHAYTGEVYEIDLDGTRYGGTLDVVTGVMRIDRGFYALTGSETWTAWGSNAFYANCLSSMSVDKDNSINCISSMAVGNTVASIYTGGAGVGTRSTRLYISTDVHTNIGTYTGMQIVYDLAEPFTVQLSHTEVRTLSGYNNIWSNTGDTNLIYETSQYDTTSNYNVGIWMNCYDQANSSSTIRVYNGSSRWPNVFLGNMTNADLPRVNGNEPYGYGLYSDNVFLRGIISATGGLIGNWTIGTTGMFYNSDAPGSTSITMIPGGTTASTTSIGGSSGSKSWIFTGKNLFGIDTTGKLYASSAEVSGKITATSGAIGGFDITATAIKTKDVEVTSNADNSISLSSADFTRTINSTSRAGLRFAIGDKFGVTGDGIIYASSVDLTGKITATSGTIGGVTANNSYGLYTNSKTSATSTNTGFLISKDGAIYLGAYNSTNKACPFQVTSAGALTATSGKIGKWNISSNGLYFGGATPDNTSVVLLPGGTNATTNVIGGSSGSNSWIFTIKDLFGVQSSGTLYAQNAHISGTLTAGANSQIGPWNVTTTSIYKGENALGSTTSGAAYFGDLGLSIGNKFKVDASGVATLGLSSGYHATMDTDSFDVLNGSTMLATFGADSVIGNMNARGVSINDKGFKFNNGGKTAFYVGVDTRSGSTSQLSTDYYLASDPETITVNEKDYYYVTTVPVDRTVIEVGHSLPLIEDDGEEYLVAADCWWYRDWIINDDKLWIADIEDYEMDESVCYIYTKSSSMSAPYCIIGKNAYSLSNAAGNMSFAQGHECMALGAYSTSVGWKNLSSGTASISSGNQSKAYGNYSFAGGFMSTTHNNNTFAYGYKANACSESSIAFGNQDCEISKIFKIKIVSHDSDTDEITCNITEDADYFEMCLYEASILVTTDNNYIFESIEVTSGSGSSNITFVCYSRNKSIPTINSYLYVRVDPAGSYGEGAMSVNSCCASDRLSTALGLGTVAPAAGLAIGQFNIPQSNVLFSIGNGSAQFNRNNAMTVDMFGNVKATKFQGEQHVLWTGGWYMTANHIINLPELISEQSTGIVLVWSGFVNNTIQNYDWFYQFIPRYHGIYNSGAGVTSGLITNSGGGAVGIKYLLVYNDHIQGHDNNSKGGTYSGITFSNYHWVLRAVVGV